MTERYTVVDSLSHKHVFKFISVSVLVLLCMWLVNMQQFGGLADAKRVYNISVAACGGANTVCDGCNILSASLTPSYMLYNSNSGELLISDNSRIRKIDANGTISTVTGTGLPSKASEGQFATSASIGNPIGLALNPLGELVVCDTMFHEIRKISGGKTYLLAGTGTGQFGSQNGLATTAASFNTPSGIVIGADGTIYIAVSGTVSTIAGNGRATSDIDGYLATSSSILKPSAIALNSNGEVVFSEPNKLRKITALGKLATIAGTGTATDTGDGGAATSATFKNIINFSIASTGDIYIVDNLSYRVRKITSATQVITTVVGTGTQGEGSDGVLATSSQLYDPTHAIIGPNGHLYVADKTTPGKIRVVNSNTKIISRFAGGWPAENSPSTAIACSANGKVSFSNGGFSFNTFTDVKTIGNDGLLHYSTLPNITSIGMKAGNTYNIIGSGYNDLNQLHLLLERSLLLKMVKDSPVIIAGYSLSSKLGFSGDGGNVRNAVFNTLQGITVSPLGELYIVDAGNNRIRKVSTNGIISTVAGNGLDKTTPLGDSGPATSAMLNYPTGVVVNSAGELFIADSGNNRVRKVATNGIITTYAGTGTGKFDNDNVVATSASLNQPYALALDANEDLYIADLNNHRIRKVTKADQKITTVAGMELQNYQQNIKDNVAATTSTLNFPRGVAVSSSGEMFISDSSNYRIRKVDTKGIITTIAGDGSSSTFSGENTFANTSVINYPYQIAVHPLNSDVYFCDSFQRVRRIDSRGIISTVAGNGKQFLAQNELTPTTSSLEYPTGIAFDKNGDLYIAESTGYKIRKIVNNTMYTYAGALGGPDSLSARFSTDDFVTYNNSIYFYDYNSFLIRKIDTTSNKIYTIAGNGWNGYSGDGGYATDAKINSKAISVSSSTGEVVFIDDKNYVVRKIGTDGIISTIAGIPGQKGFTPDGAKATSANLNFLKGVLISPKGEVFIVENNFVRIIDTKGRLYTIAGNTQYSNLQSGSALFASMTQTSFISLSGNDIYLTENGATSVRKLISQCAEGYYGDDCEYFTCFGLESNDTTVCSGYGECVDYNSCACAGGRFGTYCDKFACFGIESTNSSVCSGNGQCISPNNCTCNEPFYGDSCNLYDCYGISTANSSVCSHNGFCSAPDVCNCTTGYYDINCSEFDCFGYNHLDELACSNNGKCLAANYCSCEEGYAGRDCSSNICFGIESTNSTVCSSHGSCISPNNCSCLIGFYGSNCELFDCYEISSLSIDACSSNGNCLSPNNCSCKEGYYGNRCELFDCYGFKSNNTEVCSSHGDCLSFNNCSCHSGFYGSHCDQFDCFGTNYLKDGVCSNTGECISPNNCSCSNGFYGSNCELFNCFEISSLSNDACSSNGNCSSPNNCSCKEGYYGNRCELFDCYGYNLNVVDVCSRHGKCLSLNNCSCDSGYYGSDCARFDCYGLFNQNSTVCSGKGVCQSPNNCSCIDGFYGYQCDQYDCFGTNSLKYSVCSRHGSCISPNNCSCSTGFYGSTCNLFNCYDVSSLSIDVCSSNGNCLSPNNCSCNEGYYGNRCELFDCYGFKSDNSDVCSSHGKCLSFNNCTCNSGYYGQECEKFDCFGTESKLSDVCSQNGICASPNNCSCTEGFYGIECNKFDCFNVESNDKSVCNSHGNCISPNNCTCLEGYYGKDCSQFDCYGVNFISSNVCSGHGSCVSPNACQCNHSFTDFNCQTEKTCFEIPFEDSLVCSSHGKCVGIDNCTCDFGYSGKDCSEFTCFQKNISTACNSNGKCVALDTCKCNPGFEGATCDVINCFGKLSNSSNVCSGNGNCKKPDYCECKYGYIGDMCEAITCFGIPATNSSVCSGNGICSKVDTCNCKSTNNLQVNGTKCDLISCRGPNNVFYTQNDKRVCSGKGTCLVETKGCNCSTGYFGDYCESFTCNNVINSDSSVCSGRGSCSSYNNCVCKQDATNGFWTGTNCEKCLPNYETELTGCKTKKCNSESTCNARGVCNSTTLTCKCSGNWDGTYCTTCKQGYFGSVCDKYCDKVKNCSSHGECDVNGDCSCFNEDAKGHFEGQYCEKCKPGYYGTECSTRIIGPLKFLNMFNGIKFSLFGPASYNLNSLDCSKLIGSNDLSKFGKSPVCSWTNKPTGEFSILFGQDFSLVVNDTISLDLKVFDSTSGNLISFMVENAESPVSPIAVMNVKQLISSCENLIIDSSASFSGDRKPLIYHWSTISSPVPIVDLSNYKNVSRLELEVETGSYTFGLRVQSSISGQLSEQIQITIIKSAYPLPSVSISDLPSGLTSQSVPIVLYKVLSLPGCYYSNQSHNFEWTQTSGPAVESKIDTSDNLIIKKFLQNGEFSYTFTVKATSNVNPQSFSTGSITFTTRLNPLELTIYSSDVSKTDASIVVEYQDPDATSDTENWTWSCVELATNENCGTSVISKLSSLNGPQSSISLPSTDYQNSNSDPILRITLTISKGSRTSTSFTDFSFPNQGIIPPTINLIKYYPSNIDKILKNSDIISLDLDVSANGQKLDIDKYITRVWKLNDNVLLLSNPLLWKMSELSNSIVLDPSSLNEGSTYTISLTVTDSRLADQPKTFSQPFTIAKSPQACKCSISPSSGYALETLFTYSCVNCQNEQASLKLSYGFQYVDTTLDLIVYTGTNSYATKLPHINTAFVKITDTLTGSFTTVPVTVKVQTPIAKTLVESRKKSTAWTTIQKGLAYGDPNTLVFTSKTINYAFNAMNAIINAGLRKIKQVNCQNGQINSNGKCVCNEGFAKSDCSLSLTAWKELVDARMEAMGNTINLLNQRNPDESITNQFLILQMMVVDSLLDTYDELNDYIAVNSLKIIERLFKLSISNKNLKVSNSFELIFANIIDSVNNYLSYQDISELDGFNNESIYALFMDASSIILRRSFVGEKELSVTTKYSRIVTNKLYRNKYGLLEISDQNNSSISLPSSASYSMVEKSNRKPISFIVEFRDFLFKNQSESIELVSSKLTRNETLTKIDIRSISKLVGFMDYSIFEAFDSPLSFTFKLDNMYSINDTERLANVTSVKSENSTTTSSRFEKAEYFCAYFNTSSNLIKDAECSLTITDNIGVCDCKDKRSYMIVEEFTTRTETRQVVFEKVIPPPTPQTSTKPIDSSVAPPSVVTNSSTNVTAIVVPIIIVFIVLVNIVVLIVLLGYCIKKRKQKAAMNTNLNIAAVEMNNV